MKNIQEMSYSFDWVVHPTTEAEMDQANLKVQRNTKINNYTILFVLWIVVLVGWYLYVEHRVYGANVKLRESRVLISNCRYVGAEILTNNKNKYLFRGKLAGKFPNGTDMIMYIYADGISYHSDISDISGKSFSSDMGTQITILNHFVQLFGEKKYNFNPVTMCQINPDDSTNYKICFIQDPYTNSIIHRCAYSEEKWSNLELFGHYLFHVTPPFIYYLSI